MRVSLSGRSDKMDRMKATLIYLDDGVLISKKLYLDWKEVQKEYWENYKTSLPPMTCEELIMFFRDDFGEETHWPFSKGAMIHFFEGNLESMKSNKRGCG